MSVVPSYSSASIVSSTSDPLLESQSEVLLEEREVAVCALEWLMLLEPLMGDLAPLDFGPFDDRTAGFLLSI